MTKVLLFLTGVWTVGPTQYMLFNHPNHHPPCDSLYLKESEVADQNKKFSKYVLA